jgi:hypothetical protein
LNFGLGGESAPLGYNVEMLIVGDDISLPDNKHPRGIAGTILVHKVAGYFAERGHNLATVLREAQYAARHLQLGWRFQLSSAAGSGKRAAPSGRPSWEWASTANRAPRLSPRRTARKSLRWVETERRPAGNRPPGGDDQ